ncbi:acyl carrier protein [Corynebacterium breve]|uniref:Acyl carrier protein n=1 Tax=Corynebacterium breve TaxID=3049799 RepID=A0ABY8VBJ9_9CORY|nr:acyl carrier protein [Corynebacterium breve]WIM67046.1 acyl carrier protein [Corynebacterium breve]
MELSQRLNFELPEEPATPPASNTIGRVAQLIEDITGIDAETVTADSTRASLGIDSLSMIEIIVRAEDTFNVRIDDEAAENFVTVDDIVTYLAENA